MLTILSHNVLGACGGRYRGWLAVHEDGITILSRDTFDELDEIAYGDIINFGLSAGKVKIEKRVPKNRGTFFLTFDISGGGGPDCVYVMTSYVNAILRREGIKSNVCRIKRVDVSEGAQDEAVKAEGGLRQARSASITDRLRATTTRARGGAQGKR